MNLTFIHTYSCKYLFCHLNHHPCCWSMNHTAKDCWALQWPSMRDSRHLVHEHCKNHTHTCIHTDTQNKQENDAKKRKEKEEKLWIRTKPPMLGPIRAHCFCFVPSHDAPCCSSATWLGKIFLTETYFLNAEKCYSENAIQKSVSVEHTEFLIISFCFPHHFPLHTGDIIGWEDPFWLQRYRHIYTHIYVHMIYIYTHDIHYSFIDVISWCLFY